MNCYILILYMSRQHLVFLDVFINSSCVPRQIPKSHEIRHAVDLSGLQPSLQICMFANSTTTSYVVISFKMFHRVAESYSQ